jgi:hypothetical protein
MIIVGIAALAMLLAFVAKAMLAPSPVPPVPIQPLGSILVMGASAWKPQNS